MAIITPRSQREAQKDTRDLSAKFSDAFGKGLNAYQQYQQDKKIDSVLKNAGFDVEGLPAEYKAKAFEGLINERKIRAEYGFKGRNEQAKFDLENQQNQVGINFANKLGLDIPKGTDPNIVKAAVIKRLEQMGAREVVQPFLEQVYNEGQELVQQNASQDFASTIGGQKQRLPGFMDQLNNGGQQRTDLQQEIAPLETLSRNAPKSSRPGSKLSEEVHRLANVPDKLIASIPDASQRTLAQRQKEAAQKQISDEERLNFEREQAKKEPFESEASKLAAKASSETRGNIVREYEAALSSNLRIDKMIKKAESGELSTPLMVKTLDFLGWPLSVLNNPTTEEYAKLQNDYVRDVSSIFPGAIKNFEIESYLKTIPQLLNSDKGKILVGNNIKLLNKGKIIKYNAMVEILKENDGVTPRNLDIAINDRVRDQMADLKERFSNNTHDALDLNGPTISMLDEQGTFYDIPTKDIQKALDKGLKLPNE